MQKGTATLEKCGHFLQMLTVHLPSNPTTEYPGQMNTYVGTKSCTKLFTAALLFIIAPN